jgi:hypothetical protein
VKFADGSQCLLCYLLVQLATRESELAAANAEIGKQKTSLINAESLITQNGIDHRTHHVALRLSANFVALYSDSCNHRRLESPD